MRNERVEDSLDSEGKIGFVEAFFPILDSYSTSWRIFWTAAEDPTVGEMLPCVFVLVLVVHQHQFSLY